MIPVPWGMRNHCDEKLKRARRKAERGAFCGDASSALDLAMVGMSVS